MSLSPNERALTDEALQQLSVATKWLLRAYRAEEDNDALTDLSIATRMLELAQEPLLNAKRMIKTRKEQDNNGFVATKKRN
nr:hypothetical protein [Limosilactobacillus mucosae]